MAKEVTIGINSIKLQELNNTGADVGAPIDLGQTLEDSFSITNDEGTPVEIRVEESDSPVYSKPGAGSTNITWQSPNADIEAVAKVTGGTYTAANGYDAPLKPVTKDYRVIIDVEQGYVMTYNRVSITANFDGNLGKNNALMLTINGSVLAPVDDKKPYNLKLKA